MNIGSILGKKKAGDVGIELEAEFDAARAPVPQYKDWLAKPEGSLRDVSMEYVSASPFKVDKYLRDKIDNLCNAINAPAFKVRKDSPRTSIHVHTNILGLTPTQMFTFGVAYWTIENALFNYCGPGRKNNLFCLRLTDATGAAEYLSDTLKMCVGNELFHYLKSDAIRYSGINWNAAPKFGSLEFRGMRGSTDPEVMYTWAKGLHDLKVNSTSNFKSPAELLDSYAVMDKEVYLGRLLSPEFAKIIKSYANWTEGMDENVCILSDLAYSKSWEKFDTGFKAKPDKPKARPAHVHDDDFDNDPQQPAVNFDDFDNDPLLNNIPNPILQDDGRINWQAFGLNPPAGAVPNDRLN